MRPGGTAPRKIKYTRVFIIHALVNEQCQQSLRAYYMFTHTTYGSFHVKSPRNLQGHLSDFDETWCVCSAYGAHHPFQFLASYTT